MERSGGFWEFVPTKREQCYEVSGATEADQQVREFISSCSDVFQLEHLHKETAKALQLLEGSVEELKSADANTLTKDLNECSSVKQSRSGGNEQPLAGSVSVALNPIYDLCKNIANPSSSAQSCSEPLVRSLSIPLNLIYQLPQSKAVIIPRPLPRLPLLSRFCLRQPTLSLPSNYPLLPLPGTAMLTNEHTINVGATTKPTPRKPRKPVLCCKMATWNVRTLVDDTTESDNKPCPPKRRQAPERKTALVAEELSRLDIAFAALSDTRIPDSGEFEDGEYCFLYSGKPSSEPRSHGVALAMKRDLRSAVFDWTAINARLLHAELRMKENRKHKLHLISAYAPTFKSSEEEKRQFYDDLNLLISKIPDFDRLVLLGDFNAKAGSKSSTWNEELGRYGVGDYPNENGKLLLKFCATNSLCIANTMFDHKVEHRVTWKHPRSSNWSQVDYVIVKKKYFSDVRDARVKRSADCFTDHKLVFAKFAFMPKFIPRNTETTCGPSRKQPVADWFVDNDQEIRQVLSTKHKAYRDFLSNPSETTRNRYISASGRAKKTLRSLKAAWWEAQATHLLGIIEKIIEEPPCPEEEEQTDRI